MCHVPASHVMHVTHAMPWFAGKSCDACDPWLGLQASHVMHVTHGLICRQAMWCVWPMAWLAGKPCDACYPCDSMQTNYVLHVTHVLMCRQTTSCDMHQRRLNMASTGMSCFVSAELHLSTLPLRMAVTTTTATTTIMLPVLLILLLDYAYNNYYYCYRTCNKVSLPRKQKFSTVFNSPFFQIQIDKIWGKGNLNGILSPRAICHLCCLSSLALETKIIFTENSQSLSQRGRDPSERRSTGVNAVEDANGINIIYQRTPS